MRPLFRPLNKQAMVYIAKYDKTRSPGIHKKVIGTLKAAQSMGYKTRDWNEIHGAASRFRHICHAILDAPEKYIVIRSFTETNIFLMPFIFVARLQGKHIVVDVPSPSAVAAKEIWNQESPILRRIVRIAMLYMGGPYALWPASKIVQHASESWWFLVGNRKRTLKLGNGIDIESIPPRATSPAWPASELRLVAVATVTFWHGYDRIIRAIGEWSSDPQRPYDVSLTVIGDGRALESLKSLVNELRINRWITFTGMLNADAIYHYYEASHLAVCSLGLHRTGLRESAQLKAREYCLAGIPFVAAGRDPDFPEGIPFRIVIGLTDETSDILGAFRTFDNIRKGFTDSEIREYGRANLGFESQFKKMGIPLQRATS